MLKICEIFGYHQLIAWKYYVVTGPVNIVYASMISSEFVLFGDKAMHIKLKSLIIIR